MSQHRFTRAAVAFQEAERLGGGVEAILKLGDSYAGRGDWTTAMETWLRARTLAPGDARVYVALGEGSIAQSLFDQAQRLLDRALELQPTGPEALAAHATLGRLLMDEEPAQAAIHFRQAGDEDMLALLKTVEAEPEPGRRALMLGTAFLQRDQLTLARRELKRAIALTATPDEAHAYLGHVLDRLGETVAARASLERALQLNPDSVIAYYFLGMHERQVGNMDRAQSALWEALLRDTENAALRVAMGETFVDLGDYPHAEEWYQGAVKVAPDDIDFHLLLVHFYVDHVYRIETGALPAAQAAVALAPDDARALDLLGWANYLAGRASEGELALNQALALDPRLVSAQYHLGTLLLTSGEAELGRQHLQRAADLDTGGYFRQRAESLLADPG